MFSSSRGIMTPEEFEATLTIMQRHDTNTRALARMVLVDGKKISEVASIYGVPPGRISIVIRSVRAAHARLMRSLTILLRSIGEKGETK